MAEPTRARPLVDSLSSALGASLGVGALVSGIDVVRVAGESGAAFTVVALYALPCAALGVMLGLVSWGWRTSFGERALRRAYRRLADERDLDHRCTAALLATAVAGAVYAGVVVMLARVLVIGVQRAGVGALLVGTGAVIALPVCGAVGVVAYRATRRLPRVPVIAGVPGTVVLVALGWVLALAALALVMFTRLDWRALDLGAFTTALGYGAGVLAWIGLWYGPGTGVRQRIGHRGAIVAAAAAIAVLAGAIGLRGTPSVAAITAISEGTSGARVLLGAARSLSDRDGDGYSALLGGPDCDDGNAAVHPGAAEIPGNGVDDNCLGGDRALRTAGDGDSDAAVPREHRLAWKGNLLFILVDTTRGDRLGAAGYRAGGQSPTPRLDALAASGTYFARAHAQAPNTARSIPSIMTGLYPSQIAVDRVDRNFPVTLDSNVTMFEQLAELGLATTGFASHYYFEVNPGIRQGFAAFDNRGAVAMEKDKAEIAAPRIVPRALEALRGYGQSGERFAMFVHLFEPHSDYLRHDGVAVRSGKMSDRYDGELAFVDGWIGRLLDGLDAAGLSDDTVVVVASDHGEGFGEHRLGGRRIYYHGRTLYQEILHVPLIIRVPGQTPRRIDTPVSMVDLAPTLYDLFAAPPPPRLAGRSLVPAIAGDPLPPRPVFAELLPASYWPHEAKAMLTGDGKHKLIQYLVPDRRLELFDLEADPGESRDIAATDAALTERLRDRLIEWIELDL